MSMVRGFYYALYSYHPHRVLQSAGETTDEGSESVASFLRKEAVADGDFSLTCSRHSLESLAVETELRDFIARRLSRGAVYTGSGNVVSVPVKDLLAPLGCYFCLLRVCPPSPSAATASLSSPTAAGTPDFKRRSREYVVCYLSDRSEIDLVPFRSELDSYAQGLQTLLQHDNPADSSQVTSDVVSHLQNWQRINLFYISRSIECVGGRLPCLLYASLCCLPMDVTCTNSSCSRDDLQRFIAACSLNALMHAQTQVPQQAESSLQLIDVTPGMPEEASKPARSSGPVAVRVAGDDCEVSMTTTNSFCEEWAVALRSVPDKDNPSIVREIVENYKLKAIQHMNTLKRLLRTAETDHYTLYRAFVFLETCGMGEVLLLAATMEAEEASSKDSFEVCRVLKSFISSLPAKSRLQRKHSTTPPQFQA